MAVDITSVTGGSSSSAIKEVGSQLFSKIFGGILWFGIGILILSVLGYCGWYFLVYKKKFDIEVKVTSGRAEDKNSIFFDKAAILTDKKGGGKYLRLWGLKVEIPAPKYNIFQVAKSGDYLEILRTSENKFYYLTPSKINKKYVLKSDGKYYRMADQNKIMVDANDDYWRTKRKELNKSMFSPDSLLTKILMYLPFMISMALAIFVIYILMSHLPGILAQLGELAGKINYAQTGSVVPA